MKSFWSGLGALAEYKIQMAILGVLISLASFGTWKWKQEQHEKFLVQQQKACQQDLDIASFYVNHSKTLYAQRLKLLGQPPSADQPGINAPFKEGESYILFHTSPTDSFLPSQPRYDGAFFAPLTGRWKGTPPPLMVQARAMRGKQAVVDTSCSPKPFTVSLNDLYEKAQGNDFRF